MTVINFDIQEPSTRLQNIADGFQNAINAPGVIIGIQKNQLSSIAASGLSNIETQISSNASQLYDIGSQTKMFTSVVILKLAEKGIVNLSDLATEHLPPQYLEGIANHDTVTIQQLLNMTSGIPEYFGTTDFTNYVLSNPDTPFSTENALEIVRNEPSSFTPGTSYEYSNTNYEILGAIIEYKTGHSLSDVYQTLIFNPLGMNDTTMDRFPVPENTLHGYTLFDGTFIDSTEVMWDPGAAGGARSTANDMMRFLQALFTEGRLLSPESMMTLMSPEMNGSVETGQGFQYSLGFMIMPTESGTFIGHGGSTLSHNSYSLINLENGAIGTFVANNEYSNIDLGVQSLASLMVEWEYGIPSFHPGTDRIQFHGISATDLSLVGYNQHTLIKIGDLSIDLHAPLRALKTEMFSFDDGSHLMIGDNHNNSITTSFRDSTYHDNMQILGLGGNDFIRSGAGNDKLMGGAGRDTLMGADGDDTLYGEHGHDRLFGGNGDDFLHGGYGQDLLYGGNGSDFLYGDIGHDRLFGQNGNDILDGGSGNDTLFGQGGNDILITSDGRDHLYGGFGQDMFVITKNSGVDIIHDFSLREGDLLNLQDILSDANPEDIDSAIGDFIKFTHHRNEWTLSVDTDGQGSGDTWHKIAVLENQSNVPDDMIQLILNDQLIL